MIIIHFTANICVKHYAHRVDKTMFAFLAINKWMKLANNRKIDRDEENACDIDTETTI